VLLRVRVQRRGAGVVRIFLERLLRLVRGSLEVETPGADDQVELSRDSGPRANNAQIEHNSIIHSPIIEYFIKNSMRGRFESMAQRASQYKSIQTMSCK